MAVVHEDRVIYNTAKGLQASVLGAEIRSHNPFTNTVLVIYGVNNGIINFALMGHRSTFSHAFNTSFNNNSAMLNISRLINRQNDIIIDHEGRVTDEDIRSITTGTDLKIADMASQTIIAPDHLVRYYLQHSPEYAHMLANMNSNI